MNCENDFCIYQDEGVCTIEKISINNLGMCMECIYPKIDNEILNQAKSNFLEKYRKQIIEY